MFSYRNLMQSMIDDQPIVDEQPILNIDKIEYDVRMAKHNGSEYPSRDELQENRKILAAEEGIEFPRTEYNYLSQPEILVEDVRACSKQPIVHATLRKLEAFIFEGSELQVSPPDDHDVSEDEIQKVQSTVEDIDKIIKTSLRLRQAWRDSRIYGSAIFEMIPGKIGDWKAYQLFKRLPAHSFDWKPPQRLDYRRYTLGDIMWGIVWDRDSASMEYWQRQRVGEMPVQLTSDHILHVKKDTADAPDGDSVVAPLVSLVKKLNFADQALVQYVNRVGAPGLDVIVKEFRDESQPMNADVWDFGKRFNQAKSIGKNWGKDTVIAHPDSIELKGIDYTNPGLDPKTIIEYIEQRILYTLIPKDFTEARGSSSLGSTRANLDVLILYAMGEQEEIAAPFVELWQNILSENGYDGWKVEIVYRDLNPTNETDKFKNLAVAVTAGVFTKDELRELVGFAPLSDDQKDELEKDKPPTPLGPFGQPLKPTEPITSPTKPETKSEGIEYPTTKEKYANEPVEKPEDKALEENSEKPSWGKWMEVTRKALIDLRNEKRDTNDRDDNTFSVAMNNAELPTTPLDNDGLIGAIRKDISEEQKAAALYQNHAARTDNKVAKDTLTSIAEEEVVHAGEFSKVLDILTNGKESELLAEGIDEVQTNDKGSWDKYDAKMKGVLVAHTFSQATDSVNLPQLQFPQAEIGMCYLGSKKVGEFYSGKGLDVKYAYDPKMSGNGHMWVLVSPDHGKNWQAIDSHYGKVNGPDYYKPKYSFDKWDKVDELSSKETGILVDPKTNMPIKNESEDAKYSEIKKALGRKPKAFMEVLKKHGLKPWEVKLK